MRLYEKGSTVSPIAKALEPKATTQDNPTISARDGDSPLRSGIGSLASRSKRDESRSTTFVAVSPTKENRPPEAWRAATSDVSASADRGARRVTGCGAIDRTMDPLERASGRLGAMTPETRVGRLLSGAGLLVSTRDVMERSGIGPKLARTLLDLALTPVRDRTEPRQRATLFEFPRRSNDDPLS